MTLAALNQADQAAFIAVLGGVFEHSPWVAERAWTHRPFASGEALHAAMVAEMMAATRDDQLSLLRAHPDLGSRAKMSAASIDEQSSAGLDRLTTNDFERLRRLNGAYRERFGFPFLFAVTGATVSDVLSALDRRVNATAADEWDEALRQVARIARLRLDAILT